MEYARQPYGRMAATPEPARTSPRRKKEMDSVGNIVISKDESPRVSLPRLNEPAPQFEAKTTQGTIMLSDYKCKWVVLFSHPADFTPVCTTELTAFAKKKPEYEKLGVQLLGLSVDSVYSHLAWIRNIQEHFDVKIDYPMIADLDMKV